MRISGEGYSSRCEESTDGGAVPDAGGPPPVVEASVPPPKPDAVVTDCSVRRLVAERKGLNLYLLIDTSAWLLLRPLWTTLTTAITRFVEDPSHYGLGVGVGYIGTSCSPDAYATPRVAISELPGVADQITASFPVPINGKATDAALAGSLNYVRSVVRNDTDRETAIVLMTDNSFGDLLCGASGGEVAEQARLGLEAEPSVKTHVVALGAGGPSLPDPFALTDLKPLDDVAAAGGTGTATRILVSASADVEITKGLEKAAAKASPCAYRMPPELVRARTSLEWADGLTAAPVSWPFVSESTCGAQRAAYVSAEDPAFAMLCPAACQAVRDRPEGVLRFREEVCNP
jgi:hypothetical protein